MSNNLVTLTEQVLEAHFIHVEDDTVLVDHDSFRGRVRQLSPPVFTFLHRSHRLTEPIYQGRRTTPGEGEPNREAQRPRNGCPPDVVEMQVSHERHAD